MKKLNIIMLFAACLLCTVSCDSDRDSNPVLQFPSSFVLNTPPHASAVYDLKNTETIELTTTQPDYGFTAATTYQVQISTTGDFTNEAAYVTLATSSTGATVLVDATEMAVALVGLLGITDEKDFPTDAFPVHIRLKASLGSDLGTVYSNAIQLPNVLSYFALDAMTMPENMFVIGSITEWDWAKSYSMVPVNGTPGKFWHVLYLGAGAEIKFNSAKAWDGGEFGYLAEGRFTNASVALAGLEDSGGNIKINNAGWYVVVVTTAIEGRSYKYTVDFLKPEVYLTGDAAGGWDFFDSTNLFTVPADASGDFVSPTFVANAELRMCIKLEGIDWWKTEFIFFDGIIAYRGNGGDQDRVTVSAGQKAYLNFLTGNASVK